MRRSEKHWFTFLLLLVVAGQSSKPLLWYCLAFLNGGMSLVFQLTERE